MVSRRSSLATGEAVPVPLELPTSPRELKAVADAAMRVLLSSVADASVLGMVGALWVLSAANAAAIAIEWATGEGSLAAVIAADAARLGVLVMVALLPVALPRLYWKLGRCFAQDRQRMVERRRPAGSGARARPRRDGGRRSVSEVVVDLVCTICGLLAAVDLIQVLAPAMGSWLPVFGSGITVMARFVGSATMCVCFVPQFFATVRDM